MDCAGLEFLLGREFPYPSRPVLEPTQPPVQCIPCLISRGKAAESWCFPPVPT